MFLEKIKSKKQKKTWVYKFCRAEVYIVTVLAVLY